MQIESLRYFIELARAGSFYGAAKNTFLSQQGLNKAITSLESELGVKLVERSRRGVRLTSEGEAFLRANWKWAVSARAKALARRASASPPLTSEQVQAFVNRLAQLHADWCARLGEAGVTWKLRTMKTIWGSCHFRKRHVTYNRELARVSAELVEYVVVHELTHLRVPNHGLAFYALMDARLPGWRQLRRRLNGRRP